MISSTVDSATSGDVCGHNITSAVRIDGNENVTHTSQKFNNNNNNSSNDDSKVMLDSVITSDVSDKIFSDKPHVTPSHPLSLPNVVRVIRSDNGLVHQSKRDHN